MQEQAYEDYRIYTESNRVYHEAQQTLGNVVRDYAATLKKPNIQAFEIGCGFGDTTVQILNADSRILLFSGDKDPNMFTETNKRLILEGIKPNRVYYLQNDAVQSMKFLRNGCIDIVASAQTIHNFPNDGEGSKQDCYIEIARILTPGGLFVNADKYVHGNPDEYRAGIARRMAEFAEYAFQHRSSEKAREAITRWYEHLIHDIQPERIMHLDTAIQQLTEAGFVDIKTVWSKELEVVLTALKGGK
jgi:ubiquinone/menaquinone biosynthesis C-methylase UbiE